MIQTDVKTHLDERTRLGVAGEDTPQRPLQQTAKSPLFYAGAVTLAYLFRRQIFSPGALLFGLGFYAAKQAKTTQLTAKITGAVQGLVEEQATFTINKPADELYRMWQKIEDAPKYQERIREVRITGDKTSHWVMELPGGQTLEWDAEWTAQEEGKRLAWHTVGYTAVPSAGQVVFEPSANNRGTVVRVTQQFMLPGGKVGGLLGGLFSRTTGGFVKENLRHFKQLAEAGEVATTRGQSHGTRGFATPLQQAITGDREQQKTVPETGAIAHEEVAQ